MLFHTLEFAALFLLVLPFGLWAENRTRRVALLVASYAFYAWFSVALCSLMAFSTFLDFSVGRGLHRSQDPRRRRQLLAISLVGNLGLLFAFKYTNWFLGSINSLSMLFTGDAPFALYDIILPLGISFYTFQTLSYTIDIYRREMNPTNSLLTFALYVAFFPQLVAGPIVRAANLVPQLDRGPAFAPGQVRWGMGVFVFGLVKKVVLADNLAQIANTVFADPGSFPGWGVLLGTYAFAFQIYCDFSGYTDMARGIAAILGYDIGTNFNFPYFAVGVRDFWRRWHISLSTWLRDYLYIPMGGGRCSPARRRMNIMNTMLLGGLWHGANWTFVVWGGIHGAWISLEHALDRIGWRIGSETMSIPVRVLGTLVTFHLVCVTWIFFRAESFGDAVGILFGLLRRGPSPPLDLAMLGFVPLLLLVDLLMWKTNLTAWILRRRFAFWLAMWVGIVVTLVFGDFRGNDFVYFQF